MMGQYTPPAQTPPLGGGEHLDNPIHTLGLLGQALAGDSRGRGRIKRRSVASIANIPSHRDIGDLGFDPVSGMWTLYLVHQPQAAPCLPFTGPDLREVAAAALEALAASAGNEAFDLRKLQTAAIFNLWPGFKNIAAEEKGKQDAAKRKEYGGEGVQPPDGGAP